MIAVSLAMSDEPDFFYIVHYIVYRWYRIHGEDHLMSLLYAGGLQMLLSFILIVNIDYFVCLFLDIPPQIDKPFGWGYIIFGVFFEYIIFYRNGRYKEIFSEYDRQRFTSRMKFKCKAAKIFNFSLLLAHRKSSVAGAAHPISQIS